MVSVYVRSSLIQLHTPDAMRGRVSAVSGLFISASNELGEFRAGLAGAAFGPVAAVVGGGALAVAVTGLCAWAFPSLRKADRFVPPDPELLAEAPGKDMPAAEAQTMAAGLKPGGRVVSLSAPSRRPAPSGCRGSPESPGEGRATGRAGRCRAAGCARGPTRSGTTSSSPPS